LRRLFEQGLARRQHEFGDADARTAQAARDLALFLERSGDTAAARRAFQETLRVDEKALGVNAAQTLQDAVALAAISPPAAAAPLLLRASNSPDQTVAGPALSTLAAMRKAAGDRAGAAGLFRRAITQAEVVEGKDGAIVALLLSALASVAEPDEAIACLRRALEIDRKLSGPRAARTVQDARELSSILRRTGRVAEASAVEREFAIAPR
jgi:tetratricopeptide (TPR) repeat protein